MQNTAIGKALSRSRNALTTKMLLVMRMTAFLLILFFQASAFTESAAQVTLKESSATLEKVLKTIQAQSSYDLVFDKALLQAKAKPVTVNVTNVPVKEALDKVFAQQELLTYSLSGKIISVMERRVNPAMMPLKTEMATIDVRGKVTDENGKPVVGASVQVKGGNKGTATDENGFFVLTGVDEKATLVISAVNIETREVPVNGRQELNLVAKVKVSQLEDVAVSVNTGYQQLKPNEVTGSVVVITKQQLDQRVAPDIISKLEGITNGLVFNKDATTGNNQLRIRGESTLFGYTEPLIVVDNFPYDGNINEINPNDVESVTILKDAAAASIWGARAGNGVIIISTKRGKASNPLRVELNANLSITNKPDLFYSPLISSSDFIDIETFLFNKGRYIADLNDINLKAVSPIVEILQNRKLNLITAADSVNMINSLRGNDWRNDFLGHIYRTSVMQQYHLNLSGGHSRVSYYFAGGYDRTNQNVIGNHSSRISLNSTLNFKPSKIFDFNVNLGYVEGAAVSNGITSIPNLYPYSSLMDANGNELSIPQHRQKWEDTISARGFPNWKYYPLQERNFQDNKTRSYTTRMATALKILLMRGLSLNLGYQYYRSITETNNLRRDESYYIRNNINRFAILSSGNFIGSNYPLGGELNVSNNNQTSHNGRFNLNYDLTLGAHRISAIAGLEVREAKNAGSSSRFWGFDESTGSFVHPNLFLTYPIYPVGSSVLSSPQASYTGGVNRFRSYFGNLNYTNNDRYSIYGSGRFDQANIFGAQTNRKGTPLWSAGAKWDINKENFYKLKSIPELALRVSYGYNGNISPDLAALVTLQYQNGTLYTNLPFAEINNVPNPELRWERSGQLNIGLSFATIGKRISGNVEFFSKKGKDLIGTTPIDPTTGISRMKGNFSDMRSHGIDISLQADILRGAFRWSTQVIVNYAAEKVSRYDFKAASGQYLNAYKGDVIPLVGYPVRSIFSYKWAGLDPLTGDPLVYLGDTLNRSYTSATANAVKLSDLEYTGRFIPPVTGSVTNHFSYKGFSLSFNVAYKIGHYFRRGSIFYSAFSANGWRDGHSDIAIRWRKPGDENITNVPSFNYPDNSSVTKDLFYNNSNILIEKADHVRLQFVNLNYTFTPAALKKLHLQGLSLYFYANNLGILWRANDKGIDPDYPYLNYPPSKSYSFGLRASF